MNIQKETETRPWRFASLTENIALGTGGSTRGDGCVDMADSFLFFAHSFGQNIQSYASSPYDMHVIIKTEQMGETGNALTVRFSVWRRDGPHCMNNRLYEH